MMKSIRVLLLLAVAQILFGSCLLWEESFLSLREGNVYFLILIVEFLAFVLGLIISIPWVRKVIVFCILQRK